MEELLKFPGFLLLILAGYSAINRPLALLPQQSFALALCGLCLFVIPRSYESETVNWLGWCLIGGGCLFISIESVSVVGIVMSACMVLVGYYIADLLIADGGACSGGGGGDGGGGDGGC